MSNEWLTTGQMIDRLKVGEVAELEEGAQIPLKFGPSYKHVTKSEDEDISWCTKDGKVDDAYPVVLYGHTVNWKWRILPNYVSFEEAMKAGKEGKTIAYHTEQDKKVIRPHQLKTCAIGSLSVGSNGLLHMFEGCWTIEDDTNG